ncbi:MAG: fatty acid desaturase [Leptospiraceae bacterium]|nr:fatty acid desaturase [Leptospiraceae bacterium]MCP5493344.1 fatty acid desaturase [Leptospiraceae bacterium]
MNAILEKVNISFSNPVNEEETDLSGPRKVVSPQLYKPNLMYAILYMFISFAFYAGTIGFSYYSFANTYWWLYPVAWFLAGTGVTSLFVLGHDCAHQAFFKSNRWNDFWGHIVFVFSFYPYYAWKYSHNAHHKHTNLLQANPKDIYYDNAWIPLTSKQYKILKRMKPKKALMYRIGRLFPPFGAFMHNILTHYFPSKFNKSQRKKVILSYFILGALALGVMGGIFYLTNSVFAIFHFYVLPGLFFAFWMSLYTYQHHTSTDMKFYSPRDWNSYKGQILATYNSLSPVWFSILHLNIDVHTPHHLSTAIPCYHLREAYKELKNSKYGQDIPEGKLNFGYYVNQVKNCHIWDETKGQYLRFNEV